MKHKILAINYPTEQNGVDHFDFYKSPSFTDYDAIIIDPEDFDLWVKSENVTKYTDGPIWAYSSSDNGFSKDLHKIMSQRAQEIADLLTKTKGIVICFLRETGSVLRCALSVSSTGNATRIHKYSWIPKLDIYGPHPLNPDRKKVVYAFSPPAFEWEERRSGKEIGNVNKGHPFSRYFEALRDRIVYERIFSDADLIKFAKPIAKDKVGALISFEMLYGEGRFIFLPPPN
ncbi:MAG: hypothetical protein WC810_26960, partial [Janthinobacterium sp.]